MMPETDAELVARVKAGNREAAGRLADRYLHPSRVIALGIIGELQGAEDVCQDAFIYMIERIDDCRQPDRVAAWLFQIVRNRARNYVRDRRSGRTVSIEETTLVSSEPAPVMAAERADLRTRLLAALAQLPEQRREVVLLHDLEEWTHREIAELMDLPIGTVQSHLHYARRRLRELLPELRREES
jgi:RNA polymerase sigma-70 factor, ECF subfamily